jgi:hypothetical protein
MNFKKEIISPEVATKMLEKNTANRDVRVNSVIHYANIMKRGEWNEDSPEMIIFDSNGQLINGQHRLMAIVKSEVTLSLWVCYDAKNDVYKTLDIGAKRGLKDIMNIDGVVNNTLISAMLPDYVLHNKGMRPTNTGYNSAGLTIDMLLDAYNKRPEVWQLCATKARNYYTKIKTVGKAAFLTPKFIGVYYILCHDINPNDAAIFFDKLITGIGFTDNTDPVFHLRNYYMDIKNSDKVMKNTKTKFAYRHAMLIKAWNCFRAGKKIKSLSWLPDEEFPRLK